MNFRMWLAGGCVSVAMALGFSGAAHAEWLEGKSRHFTVVGDVSEPILRRRVERLERFDAMMRMMVPRSIESNLPVLVLPDAEKVRALGHMPDGVLAYFLPSPYGVFAVTPAQVGSDAGVSAEAVMFHEYVHHMLLGSLDESMPRWMSEGMAELFMNTRLESDGGATIGLGNSTRAYSLVRLGRWDAARLFESDIKPPQRNEVDQLYAKGWLLLHYLLFSGNRPGEFGKFTDALKRGVPQPEAARQAFGDLDKLESELEFYRRRKELPALRIAADKLGNTTQFALRRLSSAEAEIMPMRMQSMAGVREGEAVPLAVRARVAAARYPDSAFVQRAMAEIEYDARDYAAADVAIDRALAADPAFVDAMAFKGLLLGARARRDGNAALWRQARAWIVKANRAQQDNAFVLMLYFDSFHAAGEQPNAAAVQGLMRAIMLQPAYDGLRVKVALQLIAQNDIKGARAVLAPVALSPHRSSDNVHAKLLAQMDAGASVAALTAKIAELKIGTDNLFVVPVPEKPETAKPDAPKPDAGKPDAGKPS